MVKDINTKKLVSSESENVVYMPQVYINQIEFVFNKLGISIEGHSVPVAKARPGVMDCHEQLKWFRYFFDNTGKIVSVELIGPNIIPTEATNDRIKNMRYYKDKTTGEFVKGTVEDLEANADDPNKAYIGVGYNVVDNASGEEVFYSYTRTLKEEGSYVFFKYSTESFVQLCLDILNDREALTAMRDEHIKEKRAHWANCLMSLPKTDNENEIYLWSDYLNTIDFAVKDLGLRVYDRAERTSLTDKGKMTTIKRLDWLMYFWKNTHKKLVQVEPGLIARKTLCWWEDKGTGELRYGTPEEYLHAVGSECPNDKIGSAYLYDDVSGEEDTLMTNHFGLDGKVVYFKYDKDAFVRFCLSILNDKETIGMMYEVENEKSLKKWLEYRKERLKKIVEDPFGEKVVLG